MHSTIEEGPVQNLTSNFKKLEFLPSRNYDMNRFPFSIEHHHENESKIYHAVSILLVKNFNGPILDLLQLIFTIIKFIRLINGV